MTSTERATQYFRKIYKAYCHNKQRGGFHWSLVRITERSLLEGMLLLRGCSNYEKSKNGVLKLDLSPLSDRPWSLSSFEPPSLSHLFDTYFQHEGETYLLIISPEKIVSPEKTDSGLVECYRLLSVAPDDTTIMVRKVNKKDHTLSNITKAYIANYCCSIEDYE